MRFAAFAVRLAKAATAMATIDTSYHVWNDETVEVQRGWATMPTR